MLPGATISGKTTRASGQAVGRVCVSALPIDFAGVAYSQFGANVTTTATGAYTDREPGARALRDRLRVAARGSAPTPPPSSGSRASRPRTAGLVYARLAAVPAIDAVLARSGAIAGTVTDAAGQPVDFGCVAAVSQSSGLAGGDITFSFSGQYQITGGLAPGRLHRAGQQLFGGDDAGATHLGVVTVRAGHTTGKVNLRLARGGSITGKLTVIGTGAPAENVCVDASPATSSLAKQELFGSEASDQPDRELPHRRPGQRPLLDRGLHELFRPGPEPGQREPAAHGLGERGQGQAGRERGASQGGSIVGQVSGPARSPSRASAWRSTRSRAARRARRREASDAAGSTPSAAWPPAGTRLSSATRSAPTAPRAWASGGARAPGRLRRGRRRPGRPHDGSIDAALPADGTIAGSVTGTGAAPLTGVCVSAVPVAGGRARSRCRLAARYSLACITPGKYRVEFQAGCGKSGVKTQWWDAAASSATAKVITVAAGATVASIDAAMTGG